MGKDDQGRLMKFLVCDDDPADRKLVRYCLKEVVGENLQVLEAGESLEIEAALSQHSPDIVFMDLQMPGKSGIQWLQEIVARRLAPVIMLTGYGNEDVAVTSMRMGAAGYISKNNLKPQSISEAISSVKTGLNHETVPESVAVASVFDNASEKKLSAIGIETVEALAVMTEMRDPYTAGHQRRVSELAKSLAEEMKLTPDQVIAVRLAGIIHDIGKVRVPVEILTNPGRLTESEFNIIRTHPKVGFDIIRNIELPWPISRIIHEHHERNDGSGYPAALHREDIALESKILAVADVVEAMSSHRPYRPALGLDQALSEITGKLNKYDPAVVEACVSLFRENRFRL
jgi:putative two-component system response regulator